MQGANLVIKKGVIFAYRVFDIAHEINLQKAQSILESQSSKNIKRFQLKKDPLRAITIREAPLILSEGVEEDIIIIIQINGVTKTFKAGLEIKIWGYGVISLSYKIRLNESLSWKDLVQLGAILDSNSIIDTLAQKKKDEVSSQIVDALKSPYSHSVFEDYTTYLVEEMEELVKQEEEGQEPKIVNVSLRDPLEVIKKVSVADLLLGETDKQLSDSTKKSVLANMSQYTKKDLLIIDWNSAFVIDFTKEKEYQDYVDILEFSIAQMLELRIYDQLLDEKLDLLYDSMEKKQYNKISDFYLQISEDAGQLYIEFSDFFEKIDNSIKTVGDFYLAKVLRTADKRFGFQELKQSMSRKIDTLATMSKMLQGKVDSLIDEKRSRIAEKNNSTSHRLELIVIFLILVEVAQSLLTHIPAIKALFASIANLFYS